MSYMHPAALEARRKYYLRHDAYRFAAPGTPEAKMPGYLHPWAAVARAEEAKALAEEAEQAAIRAELEHLHRLVKDLRIDLALRRLRFKYSPDQPRDEVGRWTNGTSSEGAAAADGAGDGTPSDSSEAARNSESLAQDRLPRTTASDQPPRSDRHQLEAIANDPLIRAYMNEAWIASNPYGLFPREHGFWISRDDASGQLFTRPFEGRGVENTIITGPAPPDAIAFFHTHPYGGIQPGAAPPSPSDEAWAARLGLPGLIQSHVGMYYFGPPLRP